MADNDVKQIRERERNNGGCMFNIYKRKINADEMVYRLKRQLLLNIS